MEQLVKELTKRNLTISSCESLTGGLFASMLVNVSGASKVFVGSYVTYMDKCKEILVDGQDILAKHGAISFQMAKQMARKVKEKLQSDIAISFTGNAGPTASEGKEVGLVYSCLIIKDKEFIYEDHYQGDREQIRNSCIKDAITRILENL